MKLLVARFALLASLAIAGCGGNTGTQPTTLSRTLELASGSSYSGAAAVDTVDGKSVGALATFVSTRGQQVVLWGSRDETTGAIDRVHEAAYKSDTVAPLYAKYDENGGLASVKDIETGSYVTFSPLEGSSVVATGYDGEEGDSGSIRATLSNVGVTVVVLDDRGTKRTRTIPLSELGLTAKGRDLPQNEDPLAGFASVYRDSDTRTKIIAAILRAASLVVEKPFDKIISDVAGYLLLDELQKSYATFKTQGASVGSDVSGTTPLPYVAELP